MKSYCPFTVVEELLLSTHILSQQRNDPVVALCLASQRYFAATLKESPVHLQLEQYLHCAVRIYTVQICQ